MSNWATYDGGRSIGKIGAEGGLILYDEEYQKGARITLKRGKEFISVSCNFYGWMDHTRFFNALSEAEREYRSMKTAIAGMMDPLKLNRSDKLKGWEAISEFVRRFP